MADRNLTVVTSPAASAPGKQPIWMIQAEEAKLKSEAEKAAAAKAAFEATFKNVDSSNNGAIVCAADSDEDDDEDDEDRERRRLAQKPIGPVDPSKCTAAGAGIAGGTACAASTFVVVTKDADSRKVPRGGEQVRVRVSPGVGVGGSEQDGIVKDVGDGTYSVTYVVAKRGNYMVNVECNGKPIMGSPFPVFFSSGGTTTGGLLGIAPSPTFPNMVNQSMPNMPNYSGSVSGAFPGLLGMIPGIIPGAAGGVILPGIGSSLGEVCREYLSGRCAKTDCKFTHPQHHLLMTALAATTSMGNVNQAPMAPSAAAMAAAHAIVTAQVMQAHAAQAAQAQSAKESSGSAEKEAKGDTLKKTLQVSNLSTLLTPDQLKKLFGLYGTVVECSVTDSKHFAYIEYSKPEEATAALGLNNMEVAGRPLNVEMAKSLPPKSALTSSSLPLMMQQAVAMQQMQFQQALLVQQSVNQQQAANRAASMKSATELAAARAAEISRSLNPDGLVSEQKEPDKKSRSPSPSQAKSRSRSKSNSPVSYRFRRSISPRGRYSRGFRSRSPVRYRHYSSFQHGRRSYRDGKDDYSSRRDSGRSNDRRSPVSRRYRSRSGSPRIRKQYRDDSYSPKHRRDSASPRPKRSSRPDSRSPEHHKSSKSSIRKEITGKHRKRSRSRSVEENRNSEGKTRKSSRSSPRGERKSKHRHSRSRSPEEKRREGKSKHLDKRRSRSRSAEGKRHKGGDTSPRHLDDGKSKHKRRLRSKSPDHKNLPKDDVQLGIRNENVKSHKARSSNKSGDEPDSKDLKDLESDDGHGNKTDRDGHTSDRIEPTMIEQDLSE